MTLSRLPDEEELRALFEQVELPPRLAALWRDKAATPHKVRRPWLHPANPWLRAAAAGMVALTAVGVVAVVATNQPPSDKPNPDVIQTIDNAPPTRSSQPPTSSTSQPPPSGSVAPTQPGAAPPSVGQGPGGTPIGPPLGQPTPGPADPTGIAPARGPLTERPNHYNTGIPPGTTLRRHVGDLLIDTPGAIISDLEVVGVIHIWAPDVTLRRVRAVGPNQAGSVVGQGADRLTIEDSEITSMSNANTDICLSQGAVGLTVRRSLIYSCRVGIRVWARSSDTTIVDSVVVGSPLGNAVEVQGPAARIVVRHNDINGSIEASPAEYPVTDMTLENNILGDGGGTVFTAQDLPGSGPIRVLNNHFRHYGGSSRPTPVIAWNAQAPGNTWTGNVWLGTTEPVNP